MSLFSEILSGVTVLLILAVVSHFLYEWRRVDRLQVRIKIVEELIKDMREELRGFVTIPFCQLQHSDLTKLLDTKFLGTEKRLDALTGKVDALLEIARNGQKRP